MASPLGLRLELCDGGGASASRGEVHDACGDALALAAMTTTGLMPASAAAASSAATSAATAAPSATSVAASAVIVQMCMYTTILV